MTCCTVRLFSWAGNWFCGWPVAFMVGTKPFCRECYRDIVEKQLYRGEPVKVLGKEEIHAKQS